MSTIMCPGQNTAFWRPGDIFEITCPVCGDQVEFFKDDSRRRCPGCGHVFANPRLNLGCAKWCKFADKCLGINPEIMAGQELLDPEHPEEVSPPAILSEEYAEEAETEAANAAK